MVELSAGGEDAVTMREFNLKTGKVRSRAALCCRDRSRTWLGSTKTRCWWRRDWGTGSMTKSGYPFVVKLWKRGQPLEQATEVYRGARDRRCRPQLKRLHDGEGHQVTLLLHAVNFLRVGNVAACGRVE